MMRPVTPSPIGRAFHSYVGDLKDWGARISTGYATAVGLLLIGSIAVLVALGVGNAAAFRVIEEMYGTYTAYAAIGGFFLVIGLIALLAGRSMLSRPIPAVPRPHRQAEMLKRSFVTPVAMSIVSKVRPGALKKVDPVTKGLAAAAAMTFIGWIAVSHFRRSSEARED